MMSEHIKAALIVFGCLMLAMGVLPPAVIGGERGAVWAFVSEYQTLITGVMAVGAAWLTVRQMRATDQLQIAHHQQQMNVATLPSQLAIRRLMALEPKALKDCSKRAKEFVILCDGGEPNWDKKANFDLGMCVIAYRRVAESFTQSRFVSCSSLFSAEVDLQLIRVTQGVELLNAMVPEDTAILNELFHSSDRPEWYTEWLVAALNDLADSVDNLGEALASWSRMMLGYDPPTLE